jgi:uncharacterized protein (TIGR00730 family)
MKIPFDVDFEQADRFEETKVMDVRSLLDSPSYEIAFHDQSFIMSDAARSLRIQIETAKADWFLRQYGIRSTVIVFGSARFISSGRANRLLAEAKAKLAEFPRDNDLKNIVAHATQQVKMSVYYDQAREFGRIVSKENQAHLPLESKRTFDYVICTGGGPGIMEAANRGAHDVGALSIGLNIKLPFEQRPNPYISPELCFQFHYFAIRKLHFMLRAKALVVCPGGFGTFDELFEALTLRQTERMQPIPIIIFGEDFWRKVVDFNHLVETGVIDRRDLELFHFTESPHEAWEIIKSFHNKD